MKWTAAIDLDGRMLAFPSAEVATLGRHARITNALKVVSDFEDAHFGVETLPAQTVELAHVVERRLRDAGITDSVCHIVIHERQTLGDVARVFYTAIPVETRLKYRQWASEAEAPVALFPLAGALLRHALAVKDGRIVLLAHGECLDVVVPADGRIVAAERMRRYGEGDDELQRLVDRLGKLLRDLNTEGARLPATAALLWHGPGQPVLIERLRSALAAHGIELAMAETTALRVDDDQWLTSLTPLATSLPLRQADMPASGWASAVGEALAPWAIAATLTLGVGLTAFGLWRHSEAAALGQRLATLEGIGEQATLQASVRAALDELQARRPAMNDTDAWLALEERFRRTPDLVALLEDVRAAAPDDVVITEIGVVSEQNQALMVVVGRARGFAPSSQGEQALADGMRQLGYRLIRRELAAESSDNYFRIALTKGDAS